MKLGIGLYVMNSPNAVKLYMEVFGLYLGYHVLNDNGTYFHSELMKDGKEFLSVVEANETTVHGSTVHLGVTLDDAEAVEKAYKLLSDGGTIITPMGPLPWSPCAAEIIDRFGVCWYLSAPGHRPPDDFDPKLPWDSSLYKK